MSAANFFQLALLIALTAVTIVPLGRYIAKVHGSEPGEHVPGDRFFAPIERRIYRFMRVDPAAEQTWRGYTLSLISFSLVSCVVLYGFLRLQSHLPFNPTHVGAVPDHLSFNTATSFVTNTNWQSYGGEATMSHLTQIGGLLVQHFASAAVGMAVAVALIRGIVRSRTTRLGNFWVDMIRGTTRILLPMAVLFAIVLGSQGVISNFQGFQSVTTLEGVHQLIPGGPVAAFEAIKQLGSNGGGFFNVNSAHPFENPTQFSNFIELYLTFALAFGLAVAYGRLVKDRRQGRMVVGIMAGLLLAGGLLANFAETNGNPALAGSGADQSITADSSGGNMEGKDVRFGASSSALWGASSTLTSNGSVNSMHDSWTPIGSVVPFFGMLTGEVAPGGVGVGLMSLLVNILFAVFIAGLMIGRTPEYLGKKLQSKETKLIVIYVLAVPSVLLGFTAASVFVESVMHVTIWNSGTHGFSEIFYAFSSAANNNGSGFAGITAATQWMDTTLGLAMLVGRFFLIIPVMAIAGSLGRKPKVPTTSGTLATHTGVFAGLVVAVVVIVAGLTYFPAVALGPILEHLHL